MKRLPILTLILLALLVAGAQAQTKPVGTRGMEVECDHGPCLPAQDKPKTDAPPTPAELERQRIDRDLNYKKPEALTAPPQLTQEQQQQLAQAVAAAHEAQLQAEAAKARLEAASAQVQAVAFRIMALLKVSPDEFEVRQAERGFVLAPKEKKPGPQ